MKSDINQIAEELYQQACAKGWHSAEETVDHYIEKTCNNIHDEVSELHEAWRNNELHKLCDKASGMIATGLRPLTCMEEEFADILIRCLDSCRKLGINPMEVIHIKNEYNKTRAYRHGGKKS
jgi:NTP pyrophosphatase (non-canonical NTP hydrolase)